MPSLTGRPFGDRRLTLCGSLTAGVALALCSIACLAGQLELKLISRSVVENRLRAGEVPAGERQNLIAKLFQESGCPVSQQPIDRRFSNVICKLPGETSATIVIGAHFDFVDRGKGIVDDWSGVSLLASLYQTLKGERRRHTYEFVAFAGEERGLIGSSRYVKELTTEQRAAIKAFINLECLGLTPPKVWVHRSTPMLVDLLAEIANGAHIPLQGVDVDQVGDDDTHPFVRKNIPVASIHSVTQETLRVLHSNRDNIDAIHPEDYYDAYRLVAFYLAYLDGKLTP